MRASRENAKPTLLKRALACLVSAAMVVAFTPVVAWGGEATVPVGDLFVNGDTDKYSYEDRSKTLTITSSGTFTISKTDPNTATTDHIVVNAGVTANITLYNLNIQLSGGYYTDPGPSAFEISPGATVNLTLEGTNTLRSGVAKAGLQVEKQDDQAGTLVITESSTGSLSATGGGNAAGIGGGYGHNGGDITINGGTVEANGTGYGAGIGGGSGGSGGDITISGGTVIATGDGNAAGIGGGSNGYGGNITISGGTVTANGGGGHAGIGGGNNGGGGIFIHVGGTLTNNNGGPVTDSLTAGIMPDAADNSKLSSFGNLVLPTDLVIPFGKNLTIPANATVTIPAGTTLTNNGTIFNNGAITGTVDGNRPLVPESYLYCDSSGKNWQTGTKPAGEYSVVTSSDTSWSAGWYVATGTEEIPQRITVTGDVHLILADECNLTVNGGIQVSSDNSLTIYGQQLGTGKLIADASNTTYAGIGGGGTTGGTDSGNITINGGTVTANGGGGSSGGGAGIGGGSGGAGSKVTITAGTVQATGSGNGAGIGGGATVLYGGNGGEITITGGTVTAIGNGSGAGIGSGNSGYGDSSVFKTTDSGNAVVFASSIGDQRGKNSWSGVIFEGVEYVDGGFPISRDSGIDPAVTINNNLTLSSGDSLTIGSNAAVVIPKNATLTNNGTITNNGKLYVDGAFNDNASSATGGDVYYLLTLVKASVDASTASNTSSLNNATYGKAGSEIILAPIAQAGYTFGGWEVSPAGAATVSESNSFQMPAQSLTITAKWNVVYVPADPAPDPAPSPAPSTPEVGESTSGVEIPSAPSESGSSTGGSTSGSTTVDITVTDNTATTDSQGNKVDGTVSIDKVESTESSVTIPETITTGGSTFLVTEIPSGAMADNSTATSVSIPESVTSIGQGAFQNCTELTSVSVPAGVTTIEESTFAGCTSLQSVEIQGEATEIASNAFSGCSSLESIEIPASVTTIGDGAFAGCESLTSVTIPEGATVGEGAFAGCTNLTSVTIPAGATVGENAFAGCTNLTSVTVPADATIGENAFAGTGVTQVTISGNATVGESAFANSGLTEVEVSGSASVGKRAFQGCEDLTKVTLGKGLETLPAYLFKGCTSLKTVTVPSSVTKVERSVFSGCDSLKSVVLPKSVTSIGKNAFYGADKVKKLTVNSKQLTKKSVADCLKGSSVTTVYVPKSKLAAYGKLFTRQNCGKKVTLKPIK